MSDQDKSGDPPEEGMEKTLKINVDEVLGNSPAMQERIRKLEEEKKRRQEAQAQSTKTTPPAAAASRPSQDAAATSKEAEEIERRISEKRKSGAQAGSGSTGQSKSFVQLLNQDVSWDSIKKVLTYEIPSPFSGGSQTADLADVALSEGWVTEEQLAELKRSQKIASDSIGQIMVERGMITPEQLETAQAHKSRTGQPLWRTLMQLKMMVPEDVSNMIGKSMTLPFGNRPKHDPFYTWIIENGYLTDEQLDEAWADAREKQVEFISYLRNSGLVTDEIIAQSYAAKLEVSYDSLEKVVEIPPRLLRVVPSSILRRHGGLPYKLDDEKIYIAFSDADSLQEMQKLGLLLEYEVEPVMAPKATLQKLIDIHIPADQTDLAVASDEELERLERSGKVMPAVELLTVILRGLVRSRATDIHIEPGRTSTRIRYRVDGMLHDVMSVNPIIGRKVSTRIQTLADMYMGGTTLPIDGHLVMEMDEQELQFRVAVIPGVHGDKVALRLVQSELAFCSFETLGMEIEHRRLLNEILNSANGIILTTGPTGSGKTTTLYACLNVMDCFVHNVMTIEDPVEYDVAGVTQIQVNNKTGLTFSVGLRALLRQDPDILMIGEIRDPETADIAVRAAMTGHLVLSSLHSNSATAAISSLLHLGVRPFLLASAMRGILFQRLIRRICPHCKESYEADEAAKKLMDLPAEEELTLYRGTGCGECFNTGYRGRTGVYEMLHVNEEFRQAVSESAPPKRLAHVAARAGMLGLRDHAISLVKAGETTLEEMASITG